MSECVSGFEHLTNWFWNFTILKVLGMGDTKTQSLWMILFLVKIHDHTDLKTQWTELQTSEMIIVQNISMIFTIIYYD